MTNQRKQMHASRSVAVLLALFLLTGCGGGERDEATDTAAGDTIVIPAETTTPSTTATAAESPGGAALVPSTAAGTTVLVTLAENTLAMQTAAIPPGPAVFTISNAGSDEHSFEIEGPNVDRRVEGPLTAGQTATLDVMLSAGTYTAFCPLLDHRTRGETAQVTVAAP